MNVPHNALYQNCTDGLALPNKEANRAKIKKKYLYNLNHLSKFEKKIIQMSPSSKIAQMVLFC